MLMHRDGYLATVMFLVLEMPSALVLYPPPTPEFPSGLYDVVLRAVGSNMRAASSFVYISKAPDDAPAAQRGRSVSWTSYGVESPTLDVSVQVRLRSEPQWRSCQVRPLSLGVSCVRGRNGFARFVLRGNSQVSVELDHRIDRPLLIFGNLEAPEGENISGRAAKPLPPTGRRLHFSPGIHDVGRLVIPSNTEVVIEGGAWVRGHLATEGDGSGIIVRGAGVLSGELLKHPPKCSDKLAMINFCGNGIKVIGVTIVNAPTYLVEIGAFWQKECSGFGATVENTKLLAWHWTTDGIMVGRGSVVRRNFVKCNDDSLKIFMGNTLWEQNTIWQEDNGQSFMLSWITPDAESNVTVRDSTVIHVEHTSDAANCPRSVIGASHGGTGDLSNYNFENITVEGSIYRAVGLEIRANPWGHNDTGSIHDLQFADVRFHCMPKVPSVIKGTIPRGNSLRHDGHQAGEIADIAFVRLIESGAYVSNASADGTKFFLIDQSTTANVTFK